MKLSDSILQQRKDGIGGSDCAAALGLSKYKSPLEVYLDKVNPDAIEQKMTDPQYYGHRLEAFIIEEYERKTGNKCYEPKPMIKNDKYPWLFANLDAMTTDNLIVEAKNVRFFCSEWGEEGTDQIPIPYLFQCAHYCIVCDNKNGADITAFGGGQELRVYHYERNKTLEEKIIMLTHDFWYNHVRKFFPPDPITHSDLGRLYNVADEEDVLIATPELEDKLYNHYKVSQQIKEAEIKKKELQLEIQKTMKTAAYICDTNGNKLVSWNNTKSGRRTFRSFISIEEN